MQYGSTQSQGEPLSFLEVVMTGLAPDGGLFVPERLPRAGGLLETWRQLAFPALFEEIAALFVGESLSREELRGLASRSFGSLAGAPFANGEVAPVVRVGEAFVVELFHGPTLAFKDVALQFLGNLFETLLARSGARLTIAGATSGDTGSAAIHALRGKAGVEVFMLFPQGRVTPMQELQMTTVPDANIHAIAVAGSFDDAQAIVKGLFNDRGFNAEFGLGAVNSINWARVMAQIVYYFYAYFRVCEAEGLALGAPVRFSVPTGNFGNIFAGWLAREMGLPVDKLILATNANDILHRFIQGGAYRMAQVQPTYAPSMDIQVASNFERYLFFLAQRDGAQVVRWLKDLRETGTLTVTGEQHARVGRDFLSARVDDRETLETIRATHRQHGYLLDPHGAIGYRAALANKAPGVPVVTLATAHPAKFAEAIEEAIGTPPPLPPALAGLAHLPTRVQELPARLDAVRDYIAATVGAAPRPVAR